MRVPFANLFFRNFLLLLIGLIVLVFGAAFNNNCHCPVRNQIELSEESGKAFLFSPRFPRPYCSRLDCEWKITTPLNSSLVRFSAPKIDLRLNRDYIFFYDGNSEEPTHNCTGRIKSCEFLSSGPVFMVHFKTGKGSVDKYGFQATLTLVEDDYPLSVEDSDGTEHKTSSVWNFFVWILLLCVIIFIVAGLFYWFCKRRRADENRSPLLDKSSKREDSVHVSLNSPEEPNE